MLKLLLFLLLLSLSDLHAEGQPISLSVTNAPLLQVMKSIEQQSKFTFIYSSNALQNSKPVTLQVSKEPLEKVLQLCFANQPLHYETEDHFIILKVKKATIATSSSPKEIKGKVIDENGEAIIGATVHITGTTVATATDQYGYFSLGTSLEKFTLEVSSIGYETLLVSSASYATIVLKAAVNSLNETIVIAYGQTTRRFNTGTITRINANEISKQSSSNPLMLLQGRVPGLIAEQNNGIPGSHINLLVRGQSSLKQGTQPMIIIDGVPLTMNSSSLAQLGYNANQNVLNLINAADLESIEVLKDADATAIYGSQGANGVILLTTKKGSSGKTKLDVSLSNGFGKIARPVSLLSTSEYLAMRKEAFQNDGVSPDASNAPDLLQWSSTAYTDWQQMLIGGTARTGNYQASLSGGNAQTNFLLSANYYTESTVFPGDQPFRRGTARLAINHKSNNEKFRATISSYYSTDEKQFPITDLSSRIYLPPNAPAIFNPDGTLNWNDWPNDMDNPMAYALQQYRSNYDQWISNASVQYEPVKGLVAKVTGGYSFTTLKESTIIPIQAQRPTAGITGTLAFADNMLKSWIIEPQLTYTKQISHHHIELLAGASTQQRNQQNQSVQGTGYTNDDLLENIAAAPILSATNGAVLFRYQAAYGRLQYRFRDRYLFNLNFRRDASSRFGPANRFANFGAVGAAWIFSDEPFFQKIKDVFSFGKLRSSYGITGNDQIGDYRFIDSWSTNTNFQYQGNAGLLPTRFFNPYLEWERNRKFELGLDLGFFQDRLSINSNYYLSRSDNQLVNYKLPALTGFTSITQNLNAVIQNDGFEFQVSYTNSEQRKFKSTTSFTLSLPHTKLVAYPNLSTSSDNNNYIIGKPLSLVRLYQYTGISSSGVYQFTDANSDGLITTAGDQIYSDFIVRNYYGGLQQNFKWNTWELDVLLFFTKQNGLGYPYYLVNAPGTMTNQPSVVLERWDNNHQHRSVQRFTTTVGSPAYTAYTNYRNSDANVVDASFIRLRNVHLSYQFPSQWLKRWHIERAKVFAQGQNLLTLTNYEVADPETRSALSLPPLKLFSFGFQLTL